MQPIAWVYRSLIPSLTRHQHASKFTGFASLGFERRRLWTAGILYSQLLGRAVSIGALGH